MKSICTKITPYFVVHKLVCQNYVSDVPICNLLYIWNIFKYFWLYFVHSIIAEPSGKWNETKRQKSKNISKAENNHEFFSVQNGRKKVQ